MTSTSKPYANRHGYSDVEPFEVVRVISAQTMEVRRMNATLSPDWKPEFHVGGFAAHCGNQSSQKWDYASDESAPVVRIRLRKAGTWHDAGGARYCPADKPRKFHDYNF